MIRPAYQTTLTLPDGRVIRLKHAGDHAHRVTIEKGKGKHRRVLWSRTFEQDFNRLWDEAYFVPFRWGPCYFDLDQDGNWEICIATWSGGMDTVSDALLFSVKGNTLVHYGLVPDFDFEASESVL